MLVLTPAATAVVNSLTTAEGRPEGAGLRIFSDTAPAEGGLQVEIAFGPAGQDQVLAGRGRRADLRRSSGRALPRRQGARRQYRRRREAHFTLGAQPLDNHSL